MITAHKKNIIPYIIASTSVVCIVVSFSVARAAVSTFADGIVIGGTSLPSGSLLHIDGSIGATEICNELGGECTDVSNIYNTVVGGGGGGGGISGSGSTNYLPKFTDATTVGNSIIEETGGNIGISRVASHKLDVGGNIIARSGHLYLGSGAAQDLYGDNSSAIYYDSNHSTVTQMIFRDAENQQYGRVYGDGNTAAFGLLDKDGAWALRLLNDNYTEIRINSTHYFSIGPNGVSGNYGTVQTNSGGKGGWEGYSINGRAVFMHDGGGGTGIYNDVNNHWILYAGHGNHTYIYYNGGWKLRTESNGARTNGDHRANRYCDESNNSCIDTVNYDSRRTVYNCNPSPMGCNYNCAGYTTQRTSCLYYRHYDNDEGCQTLSNYSCPVYGYLVY